MPTESTPTEPNGTGRAARSYPVDAAAGPDPGEDDPGADAGGGSDPHPEPDAADPDGGRVAALERRVADLEAELDAVRGLLDGVEAVDEAAERRASTALAKVEALEARIGSEKPGLVRERLPDAATDRQKPGEDGRHRTGNRGSEPDRGGGGRRAGPRYAEESGRDERATADAELCDRGGSRPTSPAEHGRTGPDAAGATGQGSGGTGAISSVGSGESGTSTDDGDADRSLAARLRDAFR